MVIPNDRPGDEGADLRAVLYRSRFRVLLLHAREGGTVAAVQPPHATYDRRVSMRRLLMLVVLITGTCAAYAQEPAHAPNAQAAAGSLWDVLARGNRDFVAGKIVYPNI